jgi:hypothetical protein
MTAPTRLLLGGAVVTIAEAAAGTAALVLLGPDRIALFLLVCAVATGAVSALVWRLTSNAGRGPGDGGGGEGGSPTRGPDEPPPWWPGFERDFWDHVERERDRTPAPL